MCSRQSLSEQLSVPSSAARLMPSTASKVTELWNNWFYSDGSVSILILQISDGIVNQSVKPFPIPIPKCALVCRVVVFKNSKIIFIYFATLRELENFYFFKCAATNQQPSNGVNLTPVAMQVAEDLEPSRSSEVVRSQARLWLRFADVMIRKMRMKEAVSANARALKLLANVDETVLNQLDLEQKRLIEFSTLQPRFMPRRKQSLTYFLGLFLLLLKSQVAQMCTKNKNALFQ